MAFQKLPFKVFVVACLFSQRQLRIQEKNETIHISLSCLREEIE
jgi:hypothetical protein